MESDTFWPPAKYLAEQFGVHITTARRWVRERNAPAAVIMLLSRDLGIFDGRWAGWRIVNGMLQSPERIEVSACDVLSFPFMRVQIAALQHDVKAMREQRDTGLENQPEPIEWDYERLIG